MPRLGALVGHDLACLLARASALTIAAEVKRVAFAARLFGAVAELALEAAALAVSLAYGTVGGFNHPMVPAYR